jgi:hypothetical protein
VFPHRAWAYHVVSRQSWAREGYPPSLAAGPRGIAMTTERICWVRSLRLPSIPFRPRPARQKTAVAGWTSDRWPIKQCAAVAGQLGRPEWIFFVRLEFPLSGGSRLVWNLDDDIKQSSQQQKINLLVLWASRMSWPCLGVAPREGRQDGRHGRDVELGPASSAECLPVAEVRNFHSAGYARCLATSEIGVQLNTTRMRRS